MKKIPLLSTSLILAILVIISMSCKKTGLNSETAKKIQYRWQKISTSTGTDYLDGRPIIWRLQTAAPGIYTQFDSDGNMSFIYPTSTSNYYYKVDGSKILYLIAGGTMPTTPVYTDTAFIKYVDDNLLVLSTYKYFSSGAYSEVTTYIDSLKK